jgi:hypothetical protein
MDYSCMLSMLRSGDVAPSHTALEGYVWDVSNVIYPM